MNDITNNLWVEKYRPTTLEDLVVTEDIRSKIEKFRNEGEIPHLLFVGTSGIGKTSLAKILVGDVLDCEFRNINASCDGGIDTVRTEIRNFATSASFENKIKVVILGEADGLSKAAQNSLKEIIEETSAACRFVFTANDISKISTPIVSRCHEIDLSYTKTQYIKHCVKILAKEGVKITGDQLKGLADKYYPDFRAIIDDLNNNSEDGEYKPQVVSKRNFVEVLWGAISKIEKPEKIRELYITQKESFGEYSELMIDMCKYAYRNFPSEKWRGLLPIINRFIIDRKDHPDQELHFFCLILELKNL